MVRSMLSHSGLAKSLWGEAALTACFLLNRLPTSTNEGFITPHEMLFGTPPDLSRVRVWGSTCYAFESDTAALQDRALTCKLLGFMGENIHAYRLLNCATGRVITRFNVIFDESSVIKPFSPPTSTAFDFNGPLDQSQPFLSVPSLPDDANTLPPSPSSPQPEVPAPRRTGRPTSEPDRLEYHTLGGNLVEADISDMMQVMGSCYNVCSDTVEPSTYSEAVNGPDADKWLAAMGEEYQALVDNGTWQHVAAPTNDPLLKCRWVFKIKRDENGDIVKYKARLVAKGFTQQEHGINYFETFSPVAKIQTIRLLLFLAVQLAYIIVQFDIPNAYVKAPVQEDIYMEQPQGFSDGDPAHVLKLLKALYGTKQAGRCWNIEFTDFLVSLGFKQCNFDPCLFILVDGNNTILLVLYVDDVLAISND